MPLPNLKQMRSDLAAITTRLRAATGPRDAASADLEQHSKVVEGEKKRLQALEQNSDPTPQSLADEAKTRRLLVKLAKRGEELALAHAEKQAEFAALEAEVSRQTEAVRTAELEIEADGIIAELHAFAAAHHEKVADWQARARFFAPTSRHWLNDFRADAMLGANPAARGLRLIGKLLETNRVSMGEGEGSFAAADARTRPAPVETQEA